MNKAMRCPARDKDGHRCTQKAGHETLVREGAKSPEHPLHTAYGRLFPGALPTEPLPVEMPVIPAPEFVP